MKVQRKGGIPANHGVEITLKAADKEGPKASGEDFWTILEVGAEYEGRKSGPVFQGLNNMCRMDHQGE